jgi:hypothetical protein
MDDDSKKSKFIFQPHHHHISGLLVIVIILAVILLLMLKPFISNQILSNKFKEYGMTPAEIVSNIDAQKQKQDLLLTNISTQKGLIADLKDENGKLRDLMLQKDNTITGLNSSLAYKEKEYAAEVLQINQSYAQKLKSIQFDSQALNNSAAIAVSNFDQLHKSAGRSICCSAKVDNPTINSYDVISNKIVCTTNGEHVITC